MLSTGTKAGMAVISMFAAFDFCVGKLFFRLSQKLKFLS